MVASTFFLSCANEDDEDDEQGGSTLVRVFYEDLAKRVARLAGSSAVSAGSFLDKKIKAGERWEAALHDAVRTCSVFVALMSERYFTRPWCGKEWAVFSKTSYDMAAVTKTRLGTLRETLASECQDRERQGVCALREDLLDWLDGPHP